VERCPQLRRLLAASAPLQVPAAWRAEGAGSEMAQDAGAKPKLSGKLMQLKAREAPPAVAAARRSAPHV